MLEQRNMLRRRAIKLSKYFQWLFITAFVPKRKFWRWLFGDDEGKLSVPGEYVLADLREFSFAGAHQTCFHNDPVVMARRLGRREVFDRIIHYLNLDEATVQTLMEIDDGI
jgi:hypothetical protein